MADTPDNLVPWSATLPEALLLRGQHTLIIPVPEPIATLIGKILIQWGGFEVRMNSAIEGMLAGNPQLIEEGWERLGFKKRKEYWKRIAAVYLAPGDGSEIAEVARICGAAAHLHWQRNIIAHGHYVYQNEGDAIKIVAWGIHKGAQRELTLTAPFLEKLWMDLGHLNGALVSFLLRIGGRPGNAEILISDTEILQGPSESNLRSPPTLAAALLPPEPYPR